MIGIHKEKQKRKFQRMILENIHGVIRRIDYTLTDADIDIWAQ